MARVLTLVGLVLMVLVVNQAGHAATNVRPGHEVCHMFRGTWSLGHDEEPMHYVWTCNTGMVSFANRLRTRAETTDPSERCHRASIRLVVRFDGRRVMLRYVWSCTSGIVMYANGR